MKQETIEKAAENYNSQFIQQNEFAIEDFINGAKWQQQNSYSEEDMNQYSDYVLMCSAEKTFKLPLPPKEWVEQFKKK